MDKEQRRYLKGMAQELCRLRYGEIESRLRPFDTDSLVELLNSSSRKVGDSAFSCLGERSSGEDAVINAILQDRLTRRDSKIGGANFLKLRGLSHADAMRACFHLLDDNNEEVAANALFGIVFSQNKEHIPALRDKHDALGSRSWLRQELLVAIRAIEDQNPFLYSRYFSEDSAERLWGIHDARRKREAADKAVEAMSTRSLATSIRSTAARQAAK